MAKPDTYLGCYLRKRDRLKATLVKPIKVPREILDPHIRQIDILLLVISLVVSILIVQIIIIHVDCYCLLIL